MFRFMEREKASHHVATMARTLGVSPSGFYARRTRPRSLRSLADEIVVDLIREIHNDSRGTYGAPRVQAELRLAHGIGCSRFDALHGDAAQPISSDAVTAGHCAGAQFSQPSEASATPQRLLT